MHASQIREVFHHCFADTFRTRLEGGASEPLYVPAVDETGWHVIHFREDFASSALHEVSHWCIAGEARRLQPDFGYVYEGKRDQKQQHVFESFETRPQALEWIFSMAAGVPFRLSRDNFSVEVRDDDRFGEGVRLAAWQWLREGLPTRADQFARALVQRTGNVYAFETNTYHCKDVA